MYGLHGEEAMTKGISGVHFIPAKRTERADITRHAHVGESIGAMEISRRGREPGDFELMKNTINIDKYMKRFIAKTNMSFHNKSVCYRYMLKYNIKIF